VNHIFHPLSSYLERKKQMKENLQSIHLIHYAHCLVLEKKRKEKQVDGLLSAYHARYCRGGGADAGGQRKRFVFLA